MAGTCVYRRGVPGLARGLGGALAARRAPAPRRQEDEARRGQLDGAAVGPEGLQSSPPPSLLCFSAAELGAAPSSCTCYSLCYGWAPERDLHVHSFTSVSTEQVSLCLLLSSRGRQHKTLLEAPRSALAHLDHLLAEQVEQGLSLPVPTRSRAEPKKANLCFPLESIVGSVTTVEAHREDDIAESQWSLKTGGLYSAEGSSLWAWHLNDGGPPAWHLNSGDLDSFRTLFDPRFCRMPFVAGFPCQDCRSLLPTPLLAFQTGKGTQARPSQGKSDPDMEEHLAVAYERLRHELPNFFLKRHDYSMYSQDMEFDNGLLNMKTRGRPMYQVVLTLFRFLAWNYFADVHMEVLKLTQHPENWSVQARWQVTGLPFHVLIFRFYKKDKTELYRCYDAHSTFFLGPDGLICYHKVDKLMPAQPPVFKAKRLLAGLLVALGMAEHRPALNLLFSQLCRTGQKQC
ncbi:uncharacterized protein C6orf136 homolog [Pleurodeles waltl]|uniref:uncharacterized protein C6orf136 homolog n=1 Tax=Pleurodeles waltl TaxID=8319 RepID=UPI003709A2BD